jgi:two-component system, sensor histidine kinase ChiS
MKNHQTIFFFIWAGVLLFALAACNTAPESSKKNFFSSPETIAPPLMVKAGEPVIHYLKDKPPPIIIDLTAKPQPQKIPADFFISMQNFNTEHGLALSSILSGFKDKAGNLWFGTFGNGVSKYDGKSFTNYNSSNGLIHNLIEAITEDREGNIWFSTYGGISKYNGVYFENFTTEHGLPDNHINKILIDKGGNIWVATRGGLSRYNPDKSDNGKSQFINYEDKNGITGNYARWIIEDRNGNLWISGLRGVFKFNPVTGGNAETFFNDYFEITGLENEIVYCMVEDRDGLLWLGTSKGAVRFDPVKEERGLLSVTTFTQADGLISNTIESILEDRAGNIWLGSAEGISEFIKEDSSFVNYTEEQGLASSVIVCMVEDNGGSLWFGTKGHGLNKLDGKSTIEYTDSQGLPGKAVFSGTEDQNGDIWIGAENGGLTKFTKDQQNDKRGYFTNYSTNQSMQSGSILNMIVDKAGTLWFGAGYGLSKYDSKSVTTYNTLQGLITNSVISLMEDSKGNIWFGTYESGVSRFDGNAFYNYTTAQGLVHNTVWNILEDNTGAIWFATRGGLSRFDGENFINFTTSQGLPDNKLSIVTKDKNGNLLIGSWGGGVSIIRKNWVDSLNQKNVSHIEQNIFENYNTEQGLPNDVVYGILEDKKGNIIIGTSKGLTILKGGLNADRETIAKEDVEHFNQQTGYPIKDVSNNYSMFIDNSGLVWAGTGDKLVRFDYDEVHRNTRAPNVFIKGLSINHENISWQSLQRARESEVLELPQGVPAYVHNELSVFGKRLTESERDTLIHKFKKVGFDGLNPFSAIPQNLVLPYTHNTIGFDFVGIETTKPFLVKYQFMLEGSEKQWSPPSNRATAEYSNLWQGTYTFKIRALSPEGVWSEPISYTFKVLPPWWFTWWAIILYLLLFSLVLFALRRYEMKRILLQNELKFEKLTTDSLRNLDHLKSQFFANISHEFRTPLTLILGPVEQMLEASPDPKKQKSLLVMHKNAEKLLALVNQLLELSKLESGNYQLRAATGDLKGFLKGLVMSYASKAEQKNIQLNFDFDPHIEGKQFRELFYFDRDILEKIINNLLSNAFKFTPDNGSISLGACIKTVRGEGDLLEISLRDSGIGIPEEKLPYIFDRFYQVDSSAKRDYEGTGIGLAFVKELVKVHQGKIFAKSKPGKGTIFVLRLPMGKGHFLTEQIIKETKLTNGKENGAPKLPVQEPMQVFWDQNNQTAPAQHLVLIVEDHEDVRNYIRGNLEEHYRIEEAANATDGITLASETMPDLIISDIMMPGMDGFELCSVLKTDVKTSHIPVILLTARAEDEDRLHGLETGADDYLTKPFSPKELLARVNNLIENRQKLREKFSSSAIIKPGEISVTPRDRVFMEKLVKVIEDNISNEKYSIEDLSHDVGMSQSQLHRKLKAVVNQTTNHFVRSIKMHRAKELLERDAGTIAEVAYMVGYDDPGYFTKSYKAFFGQLPSEVRKKPE